MDGHGLIGDTIWMWTGEYNLLCNRFDGNSNSNFARLRTILLKRSSYPVVTVNWLLPSGLMVISTTFGVDGRTISSFILNLVYKSISSFKRVKVVFSSPCFQIWVILGLRWLWQQPRESLNPKRTSVTHRIPHPYGVRIGLILRMESVKMTQLPSGDY